MSTHRQTWGALAAVVALVVLAKTAPAQPAGAAATVNGETISMAEVESVVTMLRGGGPDAVPMPEEKRKEMRLMAVGMLIDDALWRQAFAKSPAPTPGEVAKMVADLEDGLKKSNRTLDSFCKETGQSLKQIQAKMAHLIQWKAYVKEHVSEAQLQQYYKEYKDFFDQNTVRVSHIALPIEAKTTEAERKAAWNKLIALKQDIIMGKVDFAAAAKQYSACPTANAGGDVGFIPRKWGMVDENFSKAAFDPKLKVGDITGPIQTEFGFHILKITDKKAGPPTEYDKIKEQVLQMYEDELRQSIIAQTRKTAKVVVNIQ